MGASLTLYEGLPNKIQAAKEMARAVASVVANTTVDQGEAIALVCIAEGLHAIDFSRRYHWIPGKGPSMRADAMRSEYELNFSGRADVVANSTKEARIVFTAGDGKQHDCYADRRSFFLSRWPWSKDHGWLRCNQMVYELIDAGKSDDEIFRTMQPYMKDNWGTERDWKNMMLARLTSESLRAICPKLVAGIYTPEEMEDADAIDVVGRVVSTDTAPAPKTSAMDMMRSATNGNGNGSHSPTVSTTAAAQSPQLNLGEQPSPATTNDSEADGDVVDAEFTVTTDESQLEPGDRITRSQLDKLLSLRADLADVMPAGTWEAALAKRGAKTAHSLTTQQAAELIDRLDAYRRQLQPVGN